MRRLKVEKVGETRTEAVYRIGEQTHRGNEFFQGDTKGNFKHGDVKLASELHPDVYIHSYSSTMVVNVRGQHKYSDDYLLKIPAHRENVFLEAVKAYNEAGLREAMDIKVECGTVYKPLSGGPSVYLVSQSIPCPERCNHNEWMLMYANTHRVSHCFVSIDKVREFLVGGEYHVVGEMKAEMFYDITWHADDHG